MGRLGIVEQLLSGSDGKIRGVRFQVISKGKQVKIIERPIQHIYPLKVRSPLEPTILKLPLSQKTPPPYSQICADFAQPEELLYMQETRFWE